MGDSTSAPSNVPLAESPLFNSSDADVSFISSDRILFRVHRKNLEVCTEGFPPCEVASPGSQELIPLEESSTILELLFQFIYPRRHPGLDTVAFEVLGPLAEAAEKYQVFPAMNICHIRLRDMAKEHPVEVAAYAAKHDYPCLLGEIGPMMISLPAIDVADLLPPNLFRPWTRYVQEWARIHQTIALKLPTGGDPQVSIGWSAHSSQAASSAQNHNCKNCTRNGYAITAPCSWTQLVAAVLQNLAAGVDTLRALDTVFSIPAVPKEKISKCCEWDLADWRSKIEGGIETIPKFSTFL
ncbi:unnamed protein product [Mycena citricolor]|uniref:BTB domain-containing protein n=1 Tax=Mycena citricolor TaxID=2018698 RepID=A0AAD2K0L7_9AGAR|nr:unnamed protein product [Mycena citricolor]